jgi:hypothetical protein
MLNKWPVAYIKCAIWNGVARYYVSDKPADPYRSPGYRLNGYVYATLNPERARSLATVYGHTVIEQDPIVL